MACIYLVTNSINGKRYVGFARNLEARKRVHLCEAFTRNSPFLFHKAMRKHGADAFTWEVLVESSDEQGLLRISEPFYIESLGTFHRERKGYNMTRGGDGVVGYRFTDDQKDALSAAGKGRRLSQETKDRMSIAHKGRVNAPAHNAAIAKAKAKKWAVTLPDGRTEIIDDLKSFCVSHGLRYSAMHRIAQGKMNRHRGYSVKPT